jgi:pullulanase
VLEYRQMVSDLSSINLRVVCDVVYNHTLASGPTDRNSVLDKIVPGYYHRRDLDGGYEAGP